MSAVTLVLALWLTADQPPATAESYQAQLDEAQALIKQKRCREAAVRAAAFRGSWPDDLRGYALLADAQMCLGQFAEAEKNIQWMLDLRRNDPIGLIRAARFRTLIGDFEGALQFYEQAVPRLPNSSAAHRAELLAEIARLEKRKGRTAGR